MGAIETIAINIPVVYVGASLVYHVYVTWEKCKDLFFWLTEPDELDNEEPNKMLRRMDSITIVTDDENKNVVYV